MNTRFAGFWIRLVADILDGLLLTVVSWIVEYLLLGVFYWAWSAWLSRQGQPIPSFGRAFDPLMLQVFNAGLYLCLAFPYYVWGHFRWGTTLGKRPFRIYVVSVESLGHITLNQSIARCLGYVPSYLLFGTGFLMAAFHPEKRGLHDLIARTVSIRKESA